MKHYLLYGYGGACNHGSEASIKSEIAFLRRLSPGCRITLSSHFPDYDQQFGVEADEIIGCNLKGRSAQEIYAETIRRITPETICLSVGGDIYCYPRWERYAAIHYVALERGAKSLLWRCSLEPAQLKGDLLHVISSHHLIAPRESLTAAALRERGIGHVALTADMAFQLPAEELPLPPGPYAAINLSPLILRKNPGAVDAYQSLMDEILEHTDYKIVLLPHVEISVDNDMDALNQLKGPADRVSCMPIGLRAEQYKYILANAAFCVTARTHVAIAAWSSATPTVVVAYSVKARGIAADLGQREFVADVQTLSGPRLCDMVFALLSEREAVRSTLERTAAACKARIAAPEIMAALQ